MGEKKELDKKTEFVSVGEKEKIINLPLYLSFEAGEFSLSEITREAVKITEYTGQTGDLTAGGIKIGDGTILEENAKLNLNTRIFPSEKLSEALMQSKVRITCVLDAFNLSAAEIEDLAHNSIINLDAVPGAPVFLLANGKVIALGELCTVGDRFGLRIIEIVKPESEHIIMPQTTAEPEAYCYIQLGQRQATVNELYKIGEGSIVEFEDPVSDLFPFVINGEPFFLVEILLEGDNYRARIYDHAEVRKYSAAEKKLNKPTLSKSDSKSAPTPFEQMNESEALNFNTFFGEEHPQVIALILSCLPPEVSRIALLSLPKNFRADVTKRIAEITKVGSGILAQIEKYLKDKMIEIHSQPINKTGGIEYLVNILKGIVPAERKSIIANIRQNDKALADELKKQIGG